MQVTEEMKREALTHIDKRFMAYNSDGSTFFLKLSDLIGENETETIRALLQPAPVVDVDDLIGEVIYKCGVGHGACIRYITAKYNLVPKGDK